MPLVTASGFTRNHVLIRTLDFIKDSLKDLEKEPNLNYDEIYRLRKRHYELPPPCVTADTTEEARWIREAKVTTSHRYAILTQPWIASRSWLTDNAMKINPNSGLLDLLQQMETQVWIVRTPVTLEEYFKPDNHPHHHLHSSQFQKY